MKQLLKDFYRFVSPRYQKLYSEYKVDMRPRYGHGKPPHTLLYQIINQNRDEYFSHLQSFLKFRESFLSIPPTPTETGPGWNNNFLPGLDIISLYGLLSTLRPETYVEIGSGNSTKVARKAIADNQLSTRVISVDPYPRASIDQLADTVIRKPLEETNLSFLDELRQNDVLFIDNSHRCLPNSDVTVCFLEIIPRLKRGVIVQVHDVYLPYDYPQFMCDRFYSEQYLLAILLLSNPERYRVLFPAYFVSEDDALKEVLSPLWKEPRMSNVERHGGSFWFRVEG